MRTVATILQVILPIAYGGLVFYLGRTFFHTGDTRRRMKALLPYAYAIVALHVLYIGAYTVAVHHCLLTTVFELCSLIAFTLFTVYTFVELKASQEASGTGFFVAAVAYLLQLVSSLTVSSQSPTVTRGIMLDPVFNAHVTTSVFGYAALMLAAIYGGLYLLLFRAIRKNEFGAIFQHVPSLERLERYGLRATATGFVFLSLAIGLGADLLHRYPPMLGTARLLVDPKTLTTLLVWLVFGVTLLVRKIGRLEGRRLVLFWMSGFALTVVSMTVVNAFGTEFHSFL